MLCRKRIWTLAGLFVAVLFASPSWAGSKLLNVQGKLTDSSGNPLTGNQTVTFRLYTSSTDAIASAIWTESQTLTLSTGLFSVALGTVTSLDSLGFTQTYWLGMQVAGDANELSPRQRLGASAYAQGSIGDFNVGKVLVVSSSATVGGTLVTTSSATVGGTLTVASSASATAATFTTLTVSSSVTLGTTTVNGSLMIIGGQGIIAGTMTVKGNAFSVGGSTFAVKEGTATVGGRLDLSAQGIKWADGTTSTTAASGGGPVSFATAAVTVSINGATPNGSFSACFSTATITLVGGHPIQVCFSGNAKTSINNTGGWGWNFLVDGNWPTGTSQSATIGVLSLPGTGSGVVSMSACKLIPPQGAGTKAFCQQWTNQGGTLYVPADPPGSDIAAADAVFSVMELGN